MWNPVAKVAKVAKVCNIREADLVEYAIARDSKYSICVENGEAIVSNWHSDDLVRDFLRDREAEEDDEAAYLADKHCQHLNADVGCEFDPKLG